MIKSDSFETFKAYAVAFEIRKVICLFLKDDMFKWFQLLRIENSILSFCIFEWKYISKFVCPIQTRKRDRERERHFLLLFIRQIKYLSI